MRGSICHSLTQREHRTGGFTDHVVGGRSETHQIGRPAPLNADHALATELRTLEERHRVTGRAETVLDIVGAIRARYDLVDDDVAPPPR
jgi:hypothetical protein